MRARLVAVLGAAAIAGAAIPSHAAGTPVLDGKKTKKISKTVSGGAQDHDSDLVTDQAAATDRLACAMPRCYRLQFVYKPAKGVKGDLVFKLKWTTPASDFDLYVADPKGNDIGHCGASGGTGEIISIGGSHLKRGKKYTLIADFYRSANDSVTASVEFPGTYTAGTTVPANVDGTVPTQCGVDGTQAS